MNDCSNREIWLCITSFEMPWTMQRNNKTILSRDCLWRDDYPGFLSLKEDKVMLLNAIL